MAPAATRRAGASIFANTVHQCDMGTVHSYEKCYRIIDFKCSLSYRIYVFLNGTDTMKYCSYK